MPFQVSPGVNVSEIDLTTVIPAVSTTTGAFAGVFRWGPVGMPTLIDSEITLVNRFGKPTNFNPETFFTAANFLSYGNQLFVTRTANTSSSNAEIGALNAVANVGTANALATVVKNDDSLEESGVVTNLAAETGVRFVARYPGAIGNSLKVSVCDTNTAYFSNTSLTGGDANLSSNGQLTTVVATSGSANVVVKIANSATGTLVEANTRATTLKNQLVVGDLIELGNSSIGTQKLRINTISTVSTNATHAYFTVNVDSKFSLSTFGNEEVANNLTTASGYLKRHWEYADSFDGAPGVSSYQANFGGNTSAVDEAHIAVIDEDGQFTGQPGQLLEIFSGVSRATDAKTSDGATNYYKEVVNTLSKYVYANAVRVAGYANTAQNIASLSNTQPMTLSFQSGTDGYTEANVNVATLTSGFDQYNSADNIDISLLLQGKAVGSDANKTTLANYLIDNIAEVRKDCVVFISPDKADVVNNSGQDEAADILAFRNQLTSTSYAVLDSGYKYQYDKYNDVYRYVPLNGDIAGLCVRTDDIRDPWFSPAGLNRGVIKNVVKLAYNPQKADRDFLYKNGINPVVSFTGQGTLLFGDRTLLSKPSAFDRINVRRLFIVLEKAISVASKFTLFEFNDEFTRAQFKNLVEPFLRDVQGRRGVVDFKVVCDETNNTGDVIDRNEFVGDIYIKPARSINYIQLNFVAVRSGVEFNEITGGL